MDLFLATTDERKCTFACTKPPKKSFPSLASDIHWMGRMGLPIEVVDAQMPIAPLPTARNLRPHSRRSSQAAALRNSGGIILFNSFHLYKPLCSHLFNKIIGRSCYKPLRMCTFALDLPQRTAASSTIRTLQASVDTLRVCDLGGSGGGEAATPAA